MKIPKKFIVQGAVIFILTTLATFILVRTNSKLNAASFDIKKSDILSDIISNYELNKTFNTIKKEYKGCKLNFVDYGVDGIYICTITSNDKIDSTVVQSILRKLNNKPTIIEMIQKESNYLNSMLALTQSFDSTVADMKSLTKDDIKAKISIEEMRYNLEIRKLELMNSAPKKFGFKLIGNVDYKLVKVSLLRNMLLSVILGSFLAGLNYLIQTKLGKQDA